MSMHATQTRHGPSRTRRHKLVARLNFELGSEPQNQSRIFDILRDLYEIDLAEERETPWKTVISSEQLFAEFPALAQTPSLRGDALWVELDSRSAFAMANPEFKCLSDFEFKKVERAIQQEALNALISRFPEDAAGLEEQMCVHTLVCQKLSRSDAALKTIDPRYSPLFRLGSGWFGTVYLAWDESLNRDVAIKIPYPSTLDTDLSIFRNEARNAAQLQHEHIARVIDFAQTDASCYIIYEYVRNAQDLDAYCRDHRPRLAKRLELLRQICDGLAHAH